MHPLSQVILAFVVAAVSVSSNTVSVQNKCGDGHPVVLRGAWGVVIDQGYINPGDTWSHSIDPNNCRSCKIASNTGQTLLAECKYHCRIFEYVSFDV